MKDSRSNNKKRWPVRRWIRVGFILWATFAMSWLTNSVRTQGVDEVMLLSSNTSLVDNNNAGISFMPVASTEQPALVFFSGSGIAAEAYAPLLRPIADQGYPVFIIRLPYRFAPRAEDKQGAIDRAREVILNYPDIPHWVIAGHSLGGALAARMARSDAASLSAMILVATTHPKDDNLSFLEMPVTKIYASNDGIAPPDRMMANKNLLPAHTEWVQISGGNHSQFGRYGKQLFDQTATISRQEQESLTRLAILDVLANF